MVSRDLDNKVDMGIKDSEVMDSRVDMDRDTEDSKADGDNMKDMADNRVDTDNKSTAAMDSNMKVNMVQTGTMAKDDMMTMMNSGCRDVTRVGRKKNLMKIMMKMRMMTIMVCRASMAKKKTMSLMKMKTTMASKPLCNKGARAVDLAV
jgi:hypothetical protein